MSRPRLRQDGRYEVRFVTEAGKRRSVYGRTEADVMVKWAQALSSPSTPTMPMETTLQPASPEGPQITVDELFAEYEEVARAAMKPRSFRTHQDYARLHILPALGGMMLHKLTRQHIQRLYTVKLKDLSPATIHRMHDVLASTLAHAVRWQYLEDNPATQVTPPRMEQPDIRPLSLEEVKRLLEASKQDEQYHALYVVGITTGARWGELTGLQWRDLDMNGRTMRIDRTLVAMAGGYSFGTPKTRGSRRTVRLTVMACDALRNHRAYQESQGIAATGDRLVFTNSQGKPIHNSNFIRRSFKPLLKRAGLPDTNWHAATRHTCTCLLLLNKVDPKSICMQMGWSSVAFMLTNYARFMPDWADDNAMDRILTR